MTYQITGLAPDRFAFLFAMSDLDLAKFNAVRVVAGADRGFPCRVSLRDADKGETLILVHYVCHDVATPYRSAYAIYVRENAADAAQFVDCLPPVFAGRKISLRGFDGDGMLVRASMTGGGEGEVENTISDMLADPAIAYIDTYNAAYGCFAARIERHEREPG